MRIVHRIWLGVLVLLSLLAPLAGSVAAAQTVGTSTIDGGAEWQYSIEASSSTGGILIHQSLAETYFMYLEEDLGGLAAPDADALLESTTVPRFREAFEVADMPLIAQGSLVSGVWRLYEVPSSSGTHLALFAADLTVVPGVGSVELLLSPKATFGAALASAKANITVNGFPGQLSVVPSTAILNAAGLPSTSAQAPATTPTPVVAAVPTPTPAAAQQGGSLTQTASVGQDTVAYGGDWQYNSDNSSQNVAFFVMPGASTVVYAYFSGPNTVGAGQLEAVQGATDAFFADLGAQNVQQLTAEVLPSGHAWGLTSFERNGIQAAFLIEIDVSTPGVARTQFLIAPRDGFSTHLTSAQQAFQINGVAAYSEIDVNRVMSLLGGGALAQPTPAVQVGQQTSPTQATQATGGQAADYQAQDAPSGCDGIGWVITDPAQLPASQADLDYRSSCVGGATYAASCGTYLDTGTGVHCTVNVAVGGAPMSVTSQQFTLVDAAGERYPVDVETLVTHLLLLGGPELPEATVDPGMTTSGTLIFNVPSDAPTPWVIEIAPDTLATTGERPGVLVIDGQLQPFHALAS